MRRFSTTIDIAKKRNPEPTATKHTKISNGWTRLEYWSFDAYNEATKLIKTIERCPSCPAGHIMCEAHIIAEGSIICPTGQTSFKKPTFVP